MAYRPWHAPLPDTLQPATRSPKAVRSRRGIARCDLPRDDVWTMPGFVVFSGI